MGFSFAQVRVAGAAVFIALIDLGGICRLRQDIKKFDRDGIIGQRFDCIAQPRRQHVASPKDNLRPV